MPRYGFFYFTESGKTDAGEELSAFSNAIFNLFFNIEFVKSTSSWLTLLHTTMRGEPFMALKLKFCITAICALFFCSCAVYNVPETHFETLQSGVKETQDSIHIVLRPMDVLEASLFMRGHFSKEILPAYIEVQNGTSGTIRYSGDGLMNNDLDQAFLKPYAKLGTIIEGGATVLPIVLGFAKVNAPLEILLLPLAVNTGILIYNQNTEENIATFYKSFNLNSMLYRDIPKGVQKQFLLYFENAKSDAAKISFLKKADNKLVSFTTNVKSAQAVVNKK
jgi:hypothetical protein